MDFPDQLTTEQLADMKAKGLINVVGDPGATATDPSQMGVGRAALAPLKAHAGSLALGGAGAMLAPWALGPEAGIPADIIMGTIGALGGGYAGQKAQEKLEGPEEAQALEDELQKAQASHPLVTSGSEIAASALASGGVFAPSEAVNAGRGVLAKLGGAEITPELSAAMRNVALQSAVNPAINAGIGLATGQGLPSVGDVATQAAGGALFARPSMLGNWVHSLRASTPVDTTQEDKVQPDSRADVTTGSDQPKGTVDQIVGDITQPATDKTRATTAATDVKNTGVVSPPAEDIAKQQALVKEQTGVQLPVMYKNNDLGQWGPHDQQGRPIEINPASKHWQLKSVEDPTVVPTQEPDEKQNTTEEQPEKPVTLPAPSVRSDVTGQAALPAVRPDVGPPTEALNVGPSGASAPRTDSAVEATTHGEGVEAPVLNDEREGVITKPVKGAMGVDSMVMKHSQIEVGTGSALDEHLTDHIAGVAGNAGNATVGSTLKIIANSDHPQAELAKTMLEGMDKQSLEVSINHDPSLDINSNKRSHYSPKDDRINLGTPNLTNVNTILHEASHAALYKKIPSELRNSKGSDALKAYNKYLNYPYGDENIKEIIRSYIEASKQLGLHEELFEGEHGWRESKGFPIEGAKDKGLANTHPDKVHKEGIVHGYEMANLDEFLAGIKTNRKFQEHLNNIPDGIPNSKGTLWGRLTRAISNLLGFKGVKQQSLLERVLKPTEALMKQERPGFESTGERVQAPPSKIPGTKVEKEESHLGILSRGFRAAIDKVHDIGSPAAKAVSNAMKNTLDYKQQLEGKWRNSILKVAEKAHPTDADQKRVVDIRHMESTQNKSFSYMLQNDKQRALYEAEHKSHDLSGQEALKNNEPVMRNGVPSKRILNPFHYGMTVKPEIMDVYRKGTDLPAIKKLDNAYMQHILDQGKSTTFAADQLADWKKGILGDSKSATGDSNQSYFSGARREQGFGLPRSFIGDSVTKNASRYYSRLAMDVAHYKYMEADHKVAGALGGEKDPWGNKIQQTGDSIAGNQDVKNVLHTFKGEQSDASDRIEHSISSTLSSIFIASPALEAHKALSNVVGVISLAENPFAAARSLAHGLMNIKAGYQHSVENGVTKLSARSAMDMFNGSLSGTERFSGIGKAVQSVASLNDITHKLGMGLVHSMMEATIPSKIQRAANGDRTAQQFMKNLDPSYTVGKSYTTQEQAELASKAMNYVHGTGDARTMPAWMLKDNEISGFFQLAHWSIAQTNRFMRDIYTPATKGDVAPLLHSMFGAVVGGYLIKELREDLQGKKGQIPSLSEIASSDRGLQGNVPLVAYNMIAAAQYSGFGGMLSQIAKYPFDFAYKNQPQGATFPADEIVSDLAAQLKNVSSAIANDPNVNWIKLAGAVSTHILSNNFQLGRMALNQGINSGLVSGTPADKKALADRMGELRRFNEVEGLPYNDIDEASNPYMNLEQKGFKQTQDISQAAKMLPELVQNIIQTYHSQPDVMREKLQALKTNEYGTFPSMETMPISFIKYLGYLQREEGPEKAQSELKDYVIHNAVNKAKESLVP